MYSELTSRVLVGGYVSRAINADFLVRSGVTHLVYSSNDPLSPLVSGQFWTLELKDADRDGEQKPMYWPHLFNFTRQALRKKDNKLYFHVAPEIPTRPVSPIAVYAALRALGYSGMVSRHRLQELHPIVNWHENAMAFVDHAFTAWCKEHHIKMKCVKEPAVFSRPRRDIEEDDLDALLEGASEWMQ